MSDMNYELDDEENRFGEDENVVLEEELDDDSF